MKAGRIFPLLSVLALLAASPAAAHSTLKPEEAADLAFHQRPGAALPLDAPFRDEAGRAVRLGDYFAGRPVVLALEYLGCETLCGVVLGSLAGTLDRVPLDASRDFEVVAVSIDPRDGPDAARAAKRHYLGLYHHEGGAAGWHFLTGDAAAIQRVADAVGFPFRYDAAVGQFAHPAGVTVAAPDGTISRYLLGVDYRPRDLRLGIVEAAQGTIAAPASRLLLLCYHYDPQTGRYSVPIVNALRLAGGLTVLGIAAMVVRLSRPRRG
jgi:protein SCO1/2